MMNDTKYKKRIPFYPDLIYRLPPKPTENL